MAEVSIILGAGGGIGSACCRAFAAAGRRVVAADLHQAAARQAIVGLPHGPVAKGVDVTEPGALSDLVEAAAELGPVADLVYAPGITITAPIELTDWTEYRRMMAVNLDGAFYAASAVVRIMKRQGGGGSILLLASTAGERGEPGASHYCASKFGLIGLAQSLAAELTPDRIRVNAVCPGNVDTPMLAEVVRQIAEYRSVAEAEVWDGIKRTGSSQRLIRPEEIGAACAALCSPAFSAMTGATVRLDAGALVG